MNCKNNIIPTGLLLLYILEAVLLGIAPVDRSVWWAENLTATGKVWKRMYIVFQSRVDIH